MAKTIKTIVQVMNGRTLTRREASRFAQNERRKAQRRLARILSTEVGEKIDWKNAVQKYEEIGGGEQAASLVRTIKSLQSKQVEGTKQKIGYGTSIEKEAKSISTFTQAYFGQETLAKKGVEPDLKRRNELFTHQINQSTKKNGLSSLSKSETKAFYASTMDIWNGLSTSDNFNAQIMMKFGVNDLEQIYKLLTDKELKASDFGFTDEETFNDWLDELDERVKFRKRREIVQKELETIRGNQQTGGTTADDLYNGDDVKAAETSPEFLNRIISRVATALNNG